MQLLEGIRVLDLARVVSGPFCAMTLGDLGAEVIKVEVPKVGDELRTFLPIVDGESFSFNNTNRNKFSITLDLRKQEAIEVFKRLVMTADIIVENYRPGVTQRLGIDYDTVKQWKPDIIYASISGFGQEGPYKTRAAYDVITQAMSGLMSITGYPDGTPTKVGVSMTDFLTALFNSVSILAALHHRDVTGEGQYIDTAMLDSGVAVLEGAIPTYTLTGEIQPRLGNRHPAGPIHNVFHCKDGDILLASPNQKAWTNICKLMGHEELLEDERYETMAKRKIMIDSVEGYVQDYLKDLTVEEALKNLMDIGFPCGPILNIKQVVEDPQIKFRRMVREFPHEKLGKVYMQGYPSHFSTANTEIKKLAPKLGEDTDRYLKEVGYTDEEIAELKKKDIF